MNKMHKRLFYTGYFLSFNYCCCWLGYGSKTKQEDGNWHSWLETSWEVSGLNILLCFLVSVFFAFHLRGFYWEILTLRDPFLSCVQPTNEPIRDILHPCKVFSFSSISFWFFLRISISLLTLPLCFCMLIILSMRAPNILIIVILNSWTDNANIPAMSNSDAWSVSSDFCLLGWFVSFFLIAGDDVPGRRNCWAFSDMRGSCGHMRTFL